MLLYNLYAQTTPTPKPTHFLDTVAVLPGPPFQIQLLCWLNQACPHLRLFWDCVVKKLPERNIAVPLLEYMSLHIFLNLRFWLGDFIFFCMKLAYDHRVDLGFKDSNLIS